MIKNKITAFVLYIVLFMLFWNVLDYIYSVLITHHPYHFALGMDMGLPAIFALISGYLFFLRNQSK